MAIEVPQVNAGLLANAFANKPLSSGFEMYQQSKSLLQEQQFNKVKLDQATQEKAENDQIKQLSSQVDFSNPEQVSDFESKVSKINPQKGMDVMRQRQALMKDQTDTELAQLQIYQEHNDIMGTALLGLKTKYDDMIKNGTPPAQADAAMQPDYIQAVQNLAGQKTSDGQPILGPGQIKQLQANPQFNINAINGWVANSEKAKQFLTMKLATQKQDTADKAEAERERHDREMESQGQQKIKVTQDKNSIGVMTPDAIHDAAVQYKMTGKMPSLGMGSAGLVNRARILNEYSKELRESGQNQQYVTAQQAAFKANQTAYNALQKSQAFIESFSNTALKNLNIALDESQKVDRTGSPVFNRWLLAGRKSISGDPEVAKFDTAINVAAEEYAKLLSGATGNQAATDSARKLSHDMINSAQTYEQFKGVAGIMQQEAGNRLSSTNEEIQEIQKTMGMPQTAGPPATTKPLTDEELLKKYGG